MLLPTRTVEKPWGRDRLPAPFETPQDKRIGEIWFEPPAQIPQLLVKYIFTSDKLSVQVHPSDEQTLAEGIGRQGKEECWLVVDAEPGAMLGIGFSASVDPAAMRKAALDGSIEDMLAWHEVRRGDFFYIPANTVHAIGGGVSIIEIQQNSDITYRLYDYGRPRELHLDRAIAVASGEAYDPALHRRLPEGGNASLVTGPHFRLDRIVGAPPQDWAETCSGPLLAIPLAGHMIVDGEMAAPGECAFASSIAEVGFTPEGSCLIARPLG
ncbi:mannose-6-phosphate isomerase [Altererythrobacter atlanticus]|uniref:Mannose-6-phosphate isomerase GmuF n=1 Tax=Croceibacterium atlanticum TaxID=1267766 RepID=A0A0F7KU30_9SPHN|nr:class I mannose-6-phosphate isomerase [Croceibacterium atlanticum]AKH42777.1 putative mannose-6-phosphate isomerase GmuF [Croceibacterium atlanticum]MBB5731558.1 mannose-6-phosphate isomerase [Croceibacterium atlanticum]